MRKKSELSDLTENSSHIFVIIVLAVLISLMILIAAKIYQDQHLQPEKQTTVLTFESDNFPTLQFGHYALWNVSSSDQHQFLKRFNSVNNQLVSLDGSDLTSIEIDDDTEITQLAVTIEMEGDRDEIPNNFELMLGPVVESRANLKFDMEIPIQNNSFVLATPSDGNQTINELSGIWFVDRDLERESLSLPELNNSMFIYQARVINTQINQTLMIGRFRDPKSPDDFQNHSLTFQVFNFPGEDFLRNLPDGLEPPLNLSNGNYRVIISLEPFFNDSDFTGDDIFIELFNTDISSTLPPHTPQILDYKFRPITLSIEIND